MKKVLVGGCFDILHFGHIHFLREAKSLGDYLIVALESDENVKKLKGDNRPIHTQSQRKDVLEALSYIDEVILLPEMKSDSDYEKLIVKVSPSFIAVTQGDPILDKKRSHAAKVNAKVIEIPKKETSSTSKISKILENEL